MNKFWAFVIALVVMLSGFYSIPRVINHLQSTSKEVGSIDDLKLNQYVEAQDNYTIKYNLNGGSAENPEEYNLFSETFTLNNPTKLGSQFIGWTNEELTEPTLTVTICKGSSGDIEFTANYEILLNAPSISLSSEYYPGLKLEWESVEDATYYRVFNNENLIEFQVYENQYLIPSYVVNNGLNNFCVQAVKLEDSKTIFSAYSNTIEVNILETPKVNISDDIVSWQTVENANSYIVKFSNGEIETTETSLILSEHFNLMTNEYVQYVEVFAISDDATSIPGLASFNYEGGVLDVEMTFPYTLHIEYISKETVARVDEPVADIAIWIEKDETKYSFSTTSYRDSNGLAYILTTEVQRNQLDRMFSFDGCQFKDGSAASIFSNIACWAQNYYNASIENEDGIYALNIKENIFAITAEGTGYIKNFLFNCIFDTFEYVNGN